MRANTRLTGRSAFTLVELLVVLTILVLLAALTAAAVLKFKDTGPRVATTSNLSKILANINTQWKAVRDQAAADTMSAPANQPFLTYVTSQLNLTPADPRVRALYVKLKLQQAFPTSFKEALAPGGQTNLAWPPYVRYLGKYQVTAAINFDMPPWADPTTDPPKDTLDLQQAVCVLMILEVGPKNTQITSDDLRATTVGPVDLPNNRSAPAIVDGWRQAVRFTRSYGGATDQAPALLSVGFSGKLAVNATNFTPGVAGVKDNIVVFNP